MTRPGRFASGKDSLAFVYTYEAGSHKLHRTVVLSRGLLMPKCTSRHNEAETCNMWVLKARDLQMLQLLQKWISRTKLYLVGILF